MAPFCKYYPYTTMLLLIVLTTTFHPSLQQQVENQPKLSASDYHALISIKDSLIDLPGSTFFSTWDPAASDPCTSFEGVTCSVVGSTLRVTILSLGSGLSGQLGLAGALPSSLSILTELTQLVLNPGLVTGPIPNSLSALRNLRVLSLPHNRLSGPIPWALATLSQLHTLDLSYNRLTGPVPPSLLTELTQLRVLILAGNQLTGELAQLGELTQLLHLDLKSNRLVGPIPATLPLSLRYVSLSDNLMWGPLNSLSQLTELAYLDLSMNSFSGSIPASLFRPSLTTVLLHRNNLSGPIWEQPAPDTWQYTEGSVIDLSRNALTGELPEALSGAESVYLNNNKFTGKVPQRYIDGLTQGTIKTLYLQHNFLDTFPVSLGTLPEEVEVCLAYNCMVPPIGLNTCPANAGDPMSRPAEQCLIFHNG